LDALLGNLPDAHDRRDLLGKERGGRLKAANIAERVRDLALQTQ
jgi:malonate decarboxylase gamma subunit